uniref:G-protein coupled receptors family 1 profile domain-containing protein n=1 Tax=Romanomermis culicivorax TaxID=13658 RepID=A0A915KN25_ROMCU
MTTLESQMAMPRNGTTSSTDLFLRPAQNFILSTNICSIIVDNPDRWYYDRMLQNASKYCLSPDGGNIHYDFCQGGCLSPDKAMMIQMYDLTIRWPVRFAYPIYGIVFPILLIFLVMSNIFVVVVLSKKHMISPTNTVLCYMAVADLFVGLVPAPFTFFYFTMGHFRRLEEQRRWWCYMAHYLMDVLPPIAHNSAIWLTVLLAAQRYVYIRYPQKAVKWCTISKVQKASMAILIGSLMLNCMKFYEVTFEIYGEYEFGSKNGLPNEKRLFCASFATWVQELMGKSYYPFHFWSRAIFSIILPSVVLVILNILLILSLRQAQVRRARLVCENRSREANRQKESNSTSFMLVLVVSIFLLVNLPQAFMFIIICVNEAAQLHWHFFTDEDGPTLFVMVDNMLIMVTYPLNFAIYCSTSTQFRDTFRSIFCSYVNVLATRRASSMTTYTYQKEKANNADGAAKLLVNKERMQDNDSCRYLYTFEDKPTID